MAKGKIKFWKTERGFGFIKPDDNSADVFLHFSDIVGTAEIARGLVDGAIVTYDVAPGRRPEQLKATNVRVEPRPDSERAIVFGEREGMQKFLRE